jgi:hypothetical protein
MTITTAELNALSARLNAALASFSTHVSLSVHFVVDRVNDVRNKPPISLLELEDVFTRFIAQHITAVLVLKDKETFNIRCMQTHINMPCALRRYPADPMHRINVITIMRHPTFLAKDPIDFHVV